MKYLEVYNSILPTLIAILDDEDYDKASKYRWNYRKTKQYDHTYYAYTKINGKDMYLHNLILPSPNDKVIDHINRISLDNRKCNLRICEQWENSHNTRLRTQYANKPVSSRYRGVSYQKDIKKYTAKISFKRKRLYLGVFDSERAAYKAYVDASKSVAPQFTPI